MKKKFDNKENGSMLGAIIQQARKAKKITQEELGKRVGLPKSSISKIEKGQTHISFEDASLLMDAMGEEISTLKAPSVNILADTVWLLLTRSPTKSIRY